MGLCIFHAVENLRFGLVGCHPVPGDPGLNAFYTPLQNHMMSDLPAMANCPARKREDGGGMRVCEHGTQFGREEEKMHSSG